MDRIIINTENKQIIYTVTDKVKTIVFDKEINQVTIYYYNDTFDTVHNVLTVEYRQK